MSREEITPAREEITPAREKISLVLCGGGVKGSFQAGFLTELIKHDHYEIEEIYASSIGAFIAPAVANKRIDILQDVDDFVDSFDQAFEKWPWYYFPWIYKGIVSMFFYMGIYKKHNIIDLVWNQLSDEERLKAKNMCYVPAWNIIKKRQDWFGGISSSMEDFYNGIVASLSLWLLVPPMKYNEQYYLDGGSCLFHPVGPLLEKRTDNKVIFIDTSTRKLEDVKKLPTNALELMFILHDCAVDTIATMQEKELKEMYGDQLIIVRPDTDILKNSLDLDKVNIYKTYQMGREKYLLLDK